MSLKETTKLEVRIKMVQPRAPALERFAMRTRYDFEDGLGAEHPLLRSCWGSNEGLSVHLSVHLSVPHHTLHYLIAKKRW